ncbi:hypothetical protein NCLIV_067340 [Neospora caninum Liverpool]|uniref:Uncharacterized protein n=1 Tax=Neospora caninum (strain Liverpool) TaxID=572307 RepID=F0VRG1_NEOCL|nr:hypothetical protein NCLIV_067340 [Neospora caninum Liverpool]CBZ56309.1 hypothetical protein NCLIV_067340 [Neospora caninum Liverpool]|eukprot:XP_003886334.1 hypothetical protein NCLIV_067340 [Neospora caninum Liverpool]
MDPLPHVLASASCRPALQQEATTQNHFVKVAPEKMLLPNLAFTTAQDIRASGVAAFMKGDEIRGCIDGFQPPSFTSSNSLAATPLYGHQGTEGTPEGSVSASSFSVPSKVSGDRFRFSEHFFSSFRQQCGATACAAAVVPAKENVWPWNDSSSTAPKVTWAYERNGNAAHAADREQPSERPETLEFRDAWNRGKPERDGCSVELSEKSPDSTTPHIDGGNKDFAWYHMPASSQGRDQSLPRRRAPMLSRWGDSRRDDLSSSSSLATSESVSSWASPLRSRRVPASSCPPSPFSAPVSSSSSTSDRSSAWHDAASPALGHRSSPSPVVSLSSDPSRSFSFASATPGLPAAPPSASSALSMSASRASEWGERRDSDMVIFSVGERTPARVYFLPPEESACRAEFPHPFRARAPLVSFPKSEKSVAANRALVRRFWPFGSMTDRGIPTPKRNRELSSGLAERAPQKEEEQKQSNKDLEDACPTRPPWIFEDSDRLTVEGTERRGDIVQPHCPPLPLSLVASSSPGSPSLSVPSSSPIHPTSPVCAGAAFSCRFSSGAAGDEQDAERELVSCSSVTAKDSHETLGNTELSCCSGHPVAKVLHILHEEVRKRECSSVTASGGPSRLYVKTENSFLSTDGETAATREAPVSAQASAAGDETTARSIQSTSDRVVVYASSGDSLAPSMTPSRRQSGCTCRGSARPSADDPSRLSTHQKWPTRAPEISSASRSGGVSAFDIRRGTGVARLGPSSFPAAAYAQLHTPCVGRCPFSVRAVLSKSHKPVDEAVRSALVGTPEAACVSNPRSAESSTSENTSARFGGHSRGDCSNLATDFNGSTLVVSHAAPRVRFGQGGKALPQETKMNRVRILLHGNAETTEAVENEDAGVGVGAANRGNAPLFDPSIDRKHFLRPTVCSLSRSRTDSRSGRESSASRGSSLNESISSSSPFQAQGRKNLSRADRAAARGRAAIAAAACAHRGLRRRDARQPAERGVLTELATTDASKSDQKEQKNKAFGNGEGRSSTIHRRRAAGDKQSGRSTHAATAEAACKERPRATMHASRFPGNSLSVAKQPAGSSKTLVVQEYEAREKDSPNCPKFTICVHKETDGDASSCSAPRQHNSSASFTRSAGRSPVSRGPSLQTGNGDLAGSRRIQEGGAMLRRKHDGRATVALLTRSDSDLDSVAAEREDRMRLLDYCRSILAGGVYSKMYREGPYRMKRCSYTLTWQPVCIRYSSDTASRQKERHRFLADEGSVPQATVPVTVCPQCLRKNKIHDASRQKTRLLSFTLDCLKLPTTSTHCTLTLSLALL